MYIFWFLLIACFAIYKKHKQYGAGDSSCSAERWIQGKQLLCHHCKGSQFIRREGLISTTYLLIFSLGCLNRSSSCYVCTKCSCMHWFMRSDAEVKNYRQEVVNHWQPSLSPVMLNLISCMCWNKYSIRFPANFFFVIKNASRLYPEYTLCKCSYLRKINSSVKGLIFIEEKACLEQHIFIC